MADELSSTELQQLKEIAKTLPAGHPALNKANLLLNAQPTKFEQERPGGGTLEGGPLEHGGYKSPTDTKGFGSSVWEGIKGLVRGGLKSIDPTSGLSGAGLTAIGANPREGTVSERLNEIPAVRAVHEITAAREDPTAKKKDVPLAGAGALVGESAASAREHARRGESGAIIGEATVPAVTALAAYGAPKVLPRIGAKVSSVAESAADVHPLTRLVLGHRGAALLDLLRSPEAEAPKQGLPEAAPPAPEVKPIPARAPKEVFQRPIEAAPGAGKGAPPAEMHPDELADIRKEAGKPEMTAEEAHRFRVNKMASAAASTKPANDLGGMKRAGDVTPLTEAGPTKLPTLFQKEVRPAPVKLENLVDQAAGVKPLKPDVPLREQLSPQTTIPTDVVDPIKAKYPDPAVRQMVRANGERIYEAAKGKPETVKAIHDLTRVELRQALINAGEDMGQTTVSNSKFAGEGSIPREEAFNRLLEKGLKPDEIVKLAKQAEKKTVNAEPAPHVSNLAAQRIARDRASRIREARP